MHCQISSKFKISFSCHTEMNRKSGSLKLGNKYENIIESGGLQISSVIQTESCQGKCIFCPNQTLASWLILLFIHFGGNFQANKQRPAVRNYKGTAVVGFRTTKCDELSSTAGHLQHLPFCCWRYFVHEACHILSNQIVVLNVSLIALSDPSVNLL